MVYKWFMYRRNLVLVRVVFIVQICSRALSIPHHARKRRNVVVPSGASFVGKAMGWKAEEQRFDSRLRQRICLLSIQTGCGAILFSSSMSNEVSVFISRE